LDELGLRAALVALAERTSVRHGIDVTTAIDPPRDSNWSSGLDSERETVVYRVVQEALTNAARHARSESVAVRLRQSNGEVHVSITDDGGGFDPSAPTEGFGLVGMRERVSLVGGRFEVISSAGGTTVAISLPARGDVPAHQGPNQLSPE
jgi:signal transduction histidine kinase